MEKFLFKLVIFLGSVGLVWFYAWAFNPEFSSGTIWFFAALFGSIFSDIAWLEERNK